MSVFQVNEFRTFRFAVTSESYRWVRVGRLTGEWRHLPLGRRPLYRLGPFFVTWGRQMRKGRA